MAVDKKTGQEAWKVDQTKNKGGDGFYGMWSTPLVARVNNQDQLLVSFPQQFKGLDPKTGKELWSCDGLTQLVYTSPLYSDGVAVAMSGYGGAALAVKLGGTGDISADRLWHHPRNSQRIGSGMIVGEHLYMANAGGGTAQCFELRTGKEVWKERLGPSHWGSLVLADGKFYTTDQDGDTYVFAASPKFELIGRNRLNEHTNATPSISDGEIFIRTYQHLWCISGSKP